MPKNYPPFVHQLEKNDPDLYKMVTNLFDMSLGQGELDPKTKVLIAMAIDAFAGSAEGLESLAGVARSMGISEGQIAEALRIPYMVAGNGVLHAMGSAFNPTRIV